MLGVLTAIEADSERSQRAISNELGVALGLTNAYLKRCLKKGLVKIQQVPPRRYAYYLTPQGFAEKARLSAEFLSSSLQFFRRAREQLDRLMEQCAESSRRNVVLVGISEIADLAILSAHERGLRIVGIVDPKSKLTSYMGLPVVGKISDIEADAAIITQIEDIEGGLAAVQLHLPDSRILVPDLVRIALSANKGRNRALSRSQASPKIEE